MTVRRQRFGWDTWDNEALEHVTRETTVRLSCGHQFNYDGPLPRRKNGRLAATTCHICHRRRRIHTAHIWNPPDPHPILTEHTP